MAAQDVLLLIGLCVICCSTSSPSNATDSDSQVTLERHRRLIPYMTYYVSRQQFGNQPQFHQLSGATSYASNTLAPSGADSYSAPGALPLGRQPYSSKSASYLSAPRLTNSVQYPTKNTIYSTNYRPQLAQNPRYSTINAPYFSNNVPYSTNNVPYPVHPQPYSSNNNNVPYFPKHNAQYPAKGAVSFKASPQIHYANTAVGPQYGDYDVTGNDPLSYPNNAVPYPTSSDTLLPSHQAVHTVAASIVPVIKAVTRGPVNDAYSPHATTPTRTEKESDSNTLSQILDLLREAGRLPIEEDSQPLYRAAATTPTPPPAQNINEDDYEYYDDDVDIPVPKNTFVKLTPLKQPFGTSHQNYPASEGGTPGKPGIDYPILDKIPVTEFDCKNQRYKGFFGDPDTNCQVWHYCDLNGGQASFLCPNGTIFSQVGLTCDWWFNVRCESTVQLYVLNERLYKYILPATPSFPEDYSGPVVDRYLTLKFQEKEAKRLEKESKTKT